MAASSTSIAEGRFVAAISRDSSEGDVVVVEDEKEMRVESEEREAAAYN